MVSITLSVSENLKHEMDSFPIINWSAVAREAIQNKIGMLQQFKEFTKDSELTEKDALKLGKEMSQKLSKRLLSRKRK